MTLIGAHRAHEEACFRKAVRLVLWGGQFCPQPAFSRLWPPKGGCGQDWPPSKSKRTSLIGLCIAGWPGHYRNGAVRFAYEK